MSSPSVNSTQECLTIIRARSQLQNLKSLSSHERHEIFVAKNYLVDNYDKFSRAELFEATDILSRHLKIVAGPEMTHALLKKALADKKALPFILDFSTLKKAEVASTLAPYLKLVEKYNDPKQLKHYISKYKPAVINLFKSLGKAQGSGIIEAVLAVDIELIVDVEGWGAKEKIKWVEQNPEAAYKLVLQDKLNRNVENEAIVKKPVEKEVLDKAVELYLAQLLKKVDLKNLHNNSKEKLQEVIKNLAIFTPVYALFEKNYPKENEALLEFKVSSLSPKEKSKEKYIENVAQYICLNIPKEEPAQTTDFFKRYEHLITTTPCDYMEDYYRRSISFFELCFKIKALEALRCYETKELNIEEKKMLLALSVEKFVKDRQGENIKYNLQSLELAAPELVLEYKDFITKETLPNKEQQLAWELLLSKKELEYNLAPKQDVSSKNKFKI